MTIQYDEDKPSPEDILHFGVKGMKWGQRKKVSNREIMDARMSIHGKRREIKAQKKVVKKTGTGQKKLSNLETSFLKNPDRITASRMTNGEAFASMVLFTPAGAGVAIGARMLQTKLIENEVKKAGGKVD